MGSYQPATGLRLSAHFDLGEFLRSQYAARHGIDMTPPPCVVENLRRLAVSTLEPLRDQVRRLHRPHSVVVITSGYRPPVVNAGIGGSERSAHIDGRAADIVVPGLEAREVFLELRNMARVGGVPLLDKAILEFERWVHVQVRANPHPARREFYVATRSPGGVLRYQLVEKKGQAQ